MIGVALQCERLNCGDKLNLSVKVVGIPKKLTWSVGDVDKRAKALFSKFKVTKHTAQWIFQTGVDRKISQARRKVEKSWQRKR